MSRKNVKNIETVKKNDHLELKLARFCIFLPPSLCLLDSTKDITKWLRLKRLETK